MGDLVGLAVGDVVGDAVMAMLGLNNTRNDGSVLSTLMLRNASHMDSGELVFCSSICTRSATSVPLPT